MRRLLSTRTQYANDEDCRVLVEELIEFVSIYEDRLEVQGIGAPPLLVTNLPLQEPWWGVQVVTGL